VATLCETQIKMRKVQIMQQFHFDILRPKLKLDERLLM